MIYDFKFYLFFGNELFIAQFKDVLDVSKDNNQKKISHLTFVMQSKKFVTFFFGKLDLIFKQKSRTFY